FVLARACQARRCGRSSLTPGSRDGTNRQRRGKPQPKSHPSPGGRGQVTGSTQHGLLTAGAPMGAKMFKSMVGAEFVAVVPHDVRRVVGAWRSARSPAQDGIAWTRQRWIDQFTQFAPALTMLPDRLDRSV